MPDKREFIEINSLEMRQPLGKMYVGIIDHLDLETIAYADIRRLESKTEQREVEIYSGIQRELSQKRVKDIGKYVNMIDATFPTSIILHIDPDNVEFLKASGTLKQTKVSKGVSCASMINTSRKDLRLLTERYSNSVAEYFLRNQHRHQNNR